MGFLLRSVETGSTLDLEDWRTGYIVESVEISSPDVRAVESVRPLAHGTYDYTRFGGARTVTVNLHLVPEPGIGDPRQMMLDALAPYVHPASRTDLIITTPVGGGEPRVLTCRADQFSAPWNDPGYLSVTLGWRSVGSPMLRSLDVHEASFGWEGTLLPGRTYPLMFNRVYPYARSGRGLVVNRGDQPTEWVAVVYGPITNPAIVNATTGERVQLANLTVTTPQVLVIDSEARTVMLDGVSSRYGSLDFTATRWWQLRPGDNIVRLEGSTGGGGTGTSTPSAGQPGSSSCVLRWSDAYLF